MASLSWTPTRVYNGIGGVLLSQVQDDVERVITYGSRALSKPETDYCVTRGELLAIVVFIKMFHHRLVDAQLFLRAVYPFTRHSTGSLG